MERRTHKGHARQRYPAKRRDDIGLDGGHAQQWGDLGLVTLKGVEGLWTTSALKMFDLQRSG
jgi:hypothetical protein